MKTDSNAETVVERYARFHEAEIEPLLKRRRELGGDWEDVAIGQHARVSREAGKHQRFYRKKTT